MPKAGIASILLRLGVCSTVRLSAARESVMARPDVSGILKGRPHCLTFSETPDLLRNWMLLDRT